MTPETKARQQIDQKLEQAVDLPLKQSAAQRAAQATSKKPRGRKAKGD